MEKKIKDYIIKLLNKKKKIKNKENIDNFDFISSKHLDSIELLKFNMELENKFKIEFSDKDLISKNFSRVSGLVNIIKKKVSSN